MSSSATIAPDRRYPRFASMIPALAMAFIGCAQAAIDGGMGGAGGTNAIGPQAEGCTETIACKPGTTCHNGACAKGCNRDEDCEANDYCAIESGQVCQPKAPSSCPDASCANTQACLDGLCGTQLNQPCGPSPFTMADGCPPNAVCLSQVGVDGTIVDISQCYTFPSCGADGACPVGEHGALCTAGLIGDKDPVCLPGACLGKENCPNDAQCVRLASSLVYGRCTSGAANSLCATGADCASSMCVIQTPGLYGTCK